MCIMVSKKRCDLFSRHFRPFLAGFVFWVNFFLPSPIDLVPWVFFEDKKEKFLPTGGRTGQPKVVKEVLADLKVFDCVRGEFQQHKAPFPPFHIYINGNVDVDVAVNVDVDIDSTEV